MFDPKVCATDGYPSVAWCLKNNIDRESYIKAILLKSIIATDNPIVLRKLFHQYEIFMNCVGKYTNSANTLQTTKESLNKRDSTLLSDLVIMSDGKPEVVDTLLNFCVLAEETALVSVLAHIRYLFEGETKTKQVENAYNYLANSKLYGTMYTFKKVYSSENHDWYPILIPLLEVSEFVRKVIRISSKNTFIQFDKPTFGNNGYNGKTHRNKYLCKVSKDWLKYLNVPVILDTQILNMEQSIPDVISDEPITEELAEILEMSVDIGQLYAAQNKPVILPHNQASNGRSSAYNKGGKQERYSIRATNDYIGDNDQITLIMELL